MNLFTSHSNSYLKSSPPPPPPPSWQPSSRLLPRLTNYLLVTWTTINGSLMVTVERESKRIRTPLKKPNNLLRGFLINVLARCTPLNSANLKNSAPPRSSLFFLTCPSWNPDRLTTSILQSHLFIIFFFHPHPPTYTYLFNPAILSSLSLPSLSLFFFHTPFLFHFTCHPYLSL